MNEKKKPPMLKIILGILLAVICIGGVELAVARVVDPVLYHAIVDPVVDYVTKTATYLGEQAVITGKRLQAFVQKTGDQLQQSYQRFTQETQARWLAFQESLKPPPEPEPTAEELAAAEQMLQEAQLAIPRPTADQSITHFTTEMSTGQELLVGGGHSLVYFNQTDDRWGNYGSDSIAGYGCGPTAMAMVVSTLTGRFYNPQTMADIFVEEQFWARGGGTYYNFAYGSGERFQMEVTPLPPEELTANQLSRYLMSGGLIIALMGEGHFTSGGHFIVLHGATLTGDILVADPASRERSLTTWDPKLILDELSYVRSSGAPLWLFTNPSAITEELLIP